MFNNARIYPLTHYTIMKTQKEIEELHKEVSQEMRDPATTPQRKKYLEAVVDTIIYILK